MREISPNETGKLCECLEALAKHHNQVSEYFKGDYPQTPSEQKTIQFGKELEEGRTRIAVIENDDKVTGLCKINTDGNRGVLEYLVVLEQERGKGYGAAFMTERDSLIATIPCGYGDCYPRLLTNKGRVLIHGHSAPVTGRICMDQFMVDVTDIPDVQQGDEVTIVGEDGGEWLTVEELAETAGSFNYEYVCDVTKRVPRVYIDGGRIVE